MSTDFLAHKANSHERNPSRVENVAARFRKFHALLKGGGYIAIADLDVEDGSFHTEDTGVHHFGFDRVAFAQSAAEAGFRSIRIRSASVVRKPQGDFPVFLLTAGGRRRIGQCIPTQ